MKRVLFTYDFPHKKSCDVLVRMVASDMTPDLVVGAPKKPLSIPGMTVRQWTAPIDAMHVQELCNALGVEYVVLDHNDPELPDALAGAELGIVGGARILRRHVIDAFANGILNLHPGLIPENRGLDNIAYAIAKDLPQAVTAHLIDSRVDGGECLATWLVPVRPDDSIPELGQRTLEAQNVVLAESIQMAEDKTHPRRSIGKQVQSPNKPGDRAIGRRAVEAWPAYREKWAITQGDWTNCAHTQGLTGQQEGSLLRLLDR